MAYLLGLFRSPWQIKRKKPYTATGIQRLKCIRCGKQAGFQWQICADGNNFRPICDDCDTELNKVVLKFMKHPHYRQLIAEYTGED